MLGYFAETEEIQEEKQTIGLPEEIAQRRLEEDGPNTLGVKKNKSAARIFINQFRDIMVMILLVATVISVFMGEIYDAATILLIVILNSALGFIQEYRTEKTLEALEKMTAPTARVYRDGELKTIPAQQLVRGDIIELDCGDRIPADCYIISAQGFMCDESVLTGETHPAS